MKTYSIRRLLSHAADLVLTCGLSLIAIITSQAQSNIVQNGSFEGEAYALQPWQADTSVGHQVGYAQAADGTNWVYFSGRSDITLTNLVPVLGTNQLGQPVTNGWNEVVTAAVVPGNLWQDLATVPGRVYEVSFQSGGDDTQVRVHWGSQLLGEFQLAVEQGWFKANFQVAANNTSSRLRVENLSGWTSTLTIDDFRVVWLEEQPSILQQPVGRSGYEQQTARFLVKADGAQPLEYQWYFNDAPITDAVAGLLTVPDLAIQDSGAYQVVVSNNFGSVTSRVAQLLVEPRPSTPVISAQPYSLAVADGYPVGLHASAVGAPPLTFQWLLNDAPLTRGTNATLTFQPATVADAGEYRLRVSNAYGQVTSLPAVVTVNPNAGGGFVMVKNRENISGITRPVYDFDGTTRLTGTNHVAAVYVGATPEQMRAAGSPRPFFASTVPEAAKGVFLSELAAVPDIPAGEPVYVQVKVWDILDGPTYESARANGGKFGFSKVYQTTTYSPPAIPVELVLPESFTLQSGMPLFTTGKLLAGARLPQGSVEWELHGEAGFRYLLERRSPPNNWEPFNIITNIGGITVFEDPLGSTGALRFYRARILD